jgi:hypothetical protein
MNANSQSLPKEQILYVGFNQDYGCFTCGTSNGFRIFNTFPFKDTFHRGKPLPMLTIGPL